MTSPLVKPAAGYSTLSRLDSSNCCPSTRTSSRSGIGDLLGAQVWTQPLESGEAQPTVRGPLAELDFDHLLGTYPDRVFGILAGERRRERRVGNGQGPQQAEHLALVGGLDPAADPPAEDQAPRTRYPDQQRAQRPRPRPVAADDELAGGLGLEFDPVEGPDARAVHRGQALGDHALQAVLLDGGQRRRPVEEVRRDAPAGGVPGHADAPGPGA